MRNGDPRESSADKRSASDSLAATEAAMNGETIRHTVRISNSQGMHMRPAAALVETARRFQSSVFVSKDDKRVDAKHSPLELLFLGALQGSELIVEVSGPDAREALDALLAVFATIALEDVEPETPLPPKG
jgi:phosphotransferase system HPr (HPr) family protein